MMAGLASFLGEIHPVLRNLSGITLVVFVLVVVLTSLFTVGYAIKGGQVGLQLYNALRKIRKLQRTKKRVNPDDVALVMKSEPFRHLWEEYQDSLHELRSAGNASTSIKEVRATQPAETFFTRDVLVDSRMFDDFTRHLPGVLTGLGIIGTFAGLLDGLSKFDATSSATAVAGLKPLLDGVAHAFTASAAAIGCAMFITFTSRFVLAIFYRLVEKLNHAIDALYSTGAGEEYLSRLVLASEKSEAHAAHLKQALVEDLTTLLTNLTERQISAQSKSTQELGNHIGDAIKDTLAGPLRDMTSVMQTTTQNNSQAVNGLLESMLAGFMEKLESTFGQQMRGIGDQLRQSQEVMTAAQAALQKLAQDMTTANADATTRLSSTLEEALNKAAEKQTLMTNQLREFILEFRKNSTEEHDKSKRVMDEAVGGVLTQLKAAIEQMEVVRKSAASQEQSRSDKLNNRTTELVGGLSGQVESLVKSVSEIGQVSLKAIEGMNDGAQTMEAAALRFRDAGDSVTTVFTESAKVGEQLVSTANVLQTAAIAVRQGFEQYDTTRRTVDANVAVLTTLIENARREAGLSKSMLDDLQRIVSQLQAAEKQSEKYLEGVNEALTNAFKEFGDALTTQLHRTIGDTDKHLGNGVQQLTGVVQEIGTALARMKRAA